MTILLIYKSHIILIIKLLALNANCIEYCKVLSNNKCKRRTMLVIYSKILKLIISVGNRCRQGNSVLNRENGPLKFGQLKYFRKKGMSPTGIRDN